MRRDPFNPDSCQHVGWVDSSPAAPSPWVFHEYTSQELKLNGKLT